MRYISTPLVFQDTDNGVSITHDIEGKTAMLNNLIELIVFSPRGSFNADPDFGLEYWDFEYSNINDTQFNNNSTGFDDFYNESTKRKCEESIRKSLLTYAPELKEVHISMNLDAAEANKQGRKKVFSRHMVTILAEGVIDDGLGTMSPYKKELSFLVEPTSKKI
jgi:hypothetical protein